MANATKFCVDLRIVKLKTDSPGQKPAPALGGHYAMNAGPRQRTRANYRTIFQLATPAFPNASIPSEARGEDEFPPPPPTLACSPQLPASIGVFALLS